jgi:acetyl-CoA carboxylase beta subunit
MALMKPSEREEEYFAREMFEKKQKVEQEKQKQLAEAERRKAKELHYMKCPKCGMNLVEIDYKSLKVDRCSSCEGVWLDSGELAQIIRLEKGALDKLFSVFSK